MDMILAGFADALQWGNILYLAIGVATGVLVGAVPGLNGPMAIALAVPLTFYMSPLLAIAFLVGLNKGSTFGGSIAAILLNTPGSPEAVATTFDGYPLAKKGKALKALKMALYSSVTGDTFSDLVLIFVAAPIATVALKMGPPEVLCVIIFALSLIAALESESMLKGLVAAVFGVLFACMGIDPMNASPRLTFGVMDLQSGIPLIAVGIGMLALSEVWNQLEKGAQSKENMIVIDQNLPKADQRISFREYLAAGKTILRSSLIGTAVGTLPGLGTTIAAFLGYGAAKRASKHPETFGKGELEGIAAAEAANNAVVGSNMIPLFTLGIPGNVVAALLIGAFIIHGVTPGPMMFEENGQLIYGIYAAMLVANVLNLFIGNLGLKVFAKALSAPKNIVYPLVIFVCLTGGYLAENSLLAVFIMLVFALLGYFMRKLKLSFVTFIIGFVLGPMLEMSLQQTVVMSWVNPFFITQRPIAMVFLALTVVFLWRIAHSRRKKEKAA
ncbi:tripartite tricarboxylate transporter permease [Dethiosulfatarculus sandiegensis]|uniref:Tricarboxylate transporter family protein n=1 Tax=Dethiosulfatarculus sandiegensis TaxID=1429043 RepID=A0A0D2IYQ9_9BACT|nr:tripartite tricarboxylate transporter permease [Dethiosulfatarculus sandiegensis]KIX11174.1 Tricarboxylate transporter family protein [Dethiosulfatarculus sandiegensis]